MTLPATETEEWDGLICRCVEFVTGHAQTLSVDRTDLQQVYAAFLYCRLIELVDAAAALFRNDRCAALPLIARSIFEIDVDLRNIVTYPQYSHQMHANCLHQEERFLKNSNPQRETASNSCACDPVSPALKDVEAKLSGLKEKGYKPLVISQLAKKANRQNEYHTLYWRWCLFTHNNMIALEENHMHVHDSGDYDIRIFAQSKADSVNEIDAVLSMLLFQCKEMGRLFGTSDVRNEPCFSEFERLHELRKSQLHGEKHIDLGSSDKVNDD